MKKTGRARGYALMLVLMVLFILSLSLGTLAWHLGGNVAETRRAIATIRTDSACAAALDLAGRQIEQRLRADPSTSADALTSHLCSLGPCDTADGMRLPRYLAPAGTTLAHFAVALSRPVRATTKNVATGPFRGHVAVEQTLTVVVGVKDAITGRGCSATDRFAIPSLPLTTFEMFGTAPTTRWSPPLSVRRTNDGSPSPIHVNGNTAGSQLSTGDFVLPAAQFPPEPLPIDLVRSTRGSDQVLRPAVAPGPQSSAQAGLPHSLRWLVEPPRSTDSEELRRTRLAQVADVVIVDGVWYDHRDKTLPWPGRPISSDLGGSNRTHPPPADSLVQSSATIGVGDLPFAVAGTSPLLYSWYDRDLGNDRIAFQTGGGVLSYGPLATIALGGSCLVDADCASFGPDAECFRSSSAAGSCIRVEPGLWPAPGTTCEQGNSFRGISQCPAASHAEALADGARSGPRVDERPRAGAGARRARRWRRPLQRRDLRDEPLHRRLVSRPDPEPRRRRAPAPVLQVERLRTELRRLSAGGGAERARAAGPVRRPGGPVRRAAERHRRRRLRRAGLRPRQPPQRRPCPRRRLR
jgi:hypothetical protein